MKTFLENKHNIPLSAYITDKNPSSITTNGALTIIDNSDPDNNIQGLVPNSYSIFLDNLFLASGYGFSSYSHFENALNLVTKYQSAYSYILNTFNDLQNKTFNIEYSYQNSENKIDKVYNSYGFLTEYKTIDVSRKDINTYTISLNTVHTSYVTNMELEIIGGENIFGEKYIKDDNNSHNADSLTYNYFDVSYSAEIKFWFKKNKSFDKNELKNTSPNIYFDNNLVNFDDDINTIDNGIYTYILYNFEKPQKNQTKDISLKCLRDNNIVYSHTFTNAIKWRYKIFPFNTEENNILIQLILSNILTFDDYNFGDSSFDSDNDALQQIVNFAENKKWMYLDDNTEIEFTGLGYKYQKNNQTINDYLHDYILVNDNSPKIDFYFNGIKNNSWNFIKININDNKIYRLYQSPQRYIGKHTWTIKYNYE